MTIATRSALISSRVSPDTKVRLGRLAASHGLSESALLGKLIDAVLDQSDVPEGSESFESTNERITLRLRAGDRVLADARAASRAMKTSSYLVMLIRAHLRASPVMPMHEIEELKSTVGHLASLGRQLRFISRTGVIDASAAPALRDLLQDVGHLIERVREDVAQVVRLNLRSWEIEEDEALGRVPPASETRHA